ncbi:MAG TPA: LamG domain-containing protein, partial [Bacteroidia bacterium]|nr:LamG domain-containing protein [Bacteroidia bacterium]
RFGMANQAYSFDGVSSYLNMGNPTALQINNKITVSVWINGNVFNDANSGVFHPILSKQSANTAIPKGYQLAQSFYSAFSICSEYACGATSPNGQYHSFQNPGSALTVNNWFHLVLTIDDKVLTFYQNGVNVGLNVTSQFQENILADGSLGDLLIGATTILSATPNRFFNGIIDDVIIYNRALSATEVNQLYQQTITKY